METASKTTKNQLLELELSELLLRANRIRQQFIADRVELCSITNAKSGLCNEDCKFCAQVSRYKAAKQTYPLKSVKEIVAAAKTAKCAGAGRFGIVTSGNRLNAKELGDIAAAISKIKNEVNIIVCASLGALNENELKKLKDAGLSRYHHNIETSERFYPNIVSTHSFKERIDTIRAAKQAGLEVCSGGIIGMGESWQDRIDMARTLKKLNVDSVPLNLLVPIKGTPLEFIEPISCKDAIRAIAIFRIILKDKTLKIAAGRESVLKDFQTLGFLAGANGMIIGGYLTVKGNPLQDDYKLIEQVKSLWSK
ncbi:MAG: biotin synthase BioB [Candidatus Omnitrophota bacterium]